MKADVGMVGEISKEGRSPGRPLMGGEQSEVEGDLLACARRVLDGALEERPSLRFKRYALVRRASRASQRV